MIVRIKLEQTSFPAPRIFSPSYTLLHLKSQHEYLALSLSMQTDKDSDLQVAGDPCLTLWM